MRVSRAFLLATTAGLAFASASQAQFAVVNNLPGTFAPGVDTLANFLAGSRGDDLTVAVTIPAAYGSSFLPAGTYYVDSNGRLTTDFGSVYTNQPLSASAPAGFYPHWDDLYTDDYAESGIYAADLGTMFVIQWNADPYDWDASGYPAAYPTGNAKIQLQILPTGSSTVARFLYQGLGTMTGQSATIGAVSQGALPVQYSYNTTGSISDSVVLSVVSAVTGSCCRPDGVCVITTSGGCAGLGGVYRGDNSTCATACPQPAGQYSEVGDAGDLPATAAVTTGPSTSTALTRIVGVVEFNDADMYRIRICQPASFGATTVGQTGQDTQLFLFRPNGTGIVFNDDSSGGFQSTLTSQFVSALAAGEYYLAISEYDTDPYAAGAEMWLDQPYDLERAPDGPGAAGVVDAWFSDGSESAPYAILLTGACFAQGSGPAPCYANCDSSTTAPVLNVGDFTCFLQRFAAGDSYANCDNSTTAPVLNVGDFTCFLQRFAAGCP
jgi:hypothetical protein